MTISTVMTDEYISPISIAPEVSLLLHCTRSSLSNEAKNAVDLLLAKNINLDNLLAIAKRHKVLPLVYSNLTKTRIVLEDKYFKQSLLQSIQKNTARNLQLTRELLRILNVLENNDILAVPVKGSILAEQAYQNFGLRSVSDIDLIVKKEDYLATKELLIELDYIPSTANNEDYYQQGQYYRKASLVFSIDLHYAFAPKNHFASVDSTIFWDNTTTTTLANKPIQTFSVEFTAIHICLEGLKENWRILNRLCDLSELVTNQDVDWKKLLINADKLQKKQVVCVGLYLAKTLLNTPIPDDVFLEIESCLAKKISKQQICDFLFRDLKITEDDTSKSSFLATARWYLFTSQVFPSLLDKLKYFYQISAIKLGSKKD